ncbi:hypothetical protein CBR_g28779 [Chara braunii]|uniref:VWFA domain-containing protein n=1 Tax=Chara braunii TaxID=69332 RepID=A0A388L9S3_CHABU|nr:hypothetical protein CBR_g28779 [Chara braunii]|eukprot:GBG79065.1 hypothetical protein CBR_g28779 [Chara braunii]
MEHSQFGPFDDRTSRLDVLRRTLYRLLKTFRVEDRLAFTTFPDADLDVGEELVRMITDPLRCINVTTSMQKMSPLNPKEDLTEGIQRAVSKLRDMWRASNAQDEPEVLLVFTRGKVDVETAAAAINAYNNETQRNLAVFVYGVDVTNFNDFANYTKLAAAVNGTATHLGMSDPLLGIYSYFNYLAQFRRNVTEPFFAEKYRDVTDRGNATTVVMPVFDSPGRFIGVAAIDLRQQSPENETTVNSLIAGKENDKPKPAILGNLRDTLKLPDCSSDTWPCYDGFGNISCDTRAEQFAVKKEHVIRESTDDQPNRCVKCCGNCGGCGGGGGGGGGDGDGGGDGGGGGGGGEGGGGGGGGLKLWAKVVIPLAAILVAAVAAVVLLRIYYQHCHGSRPSQKPYPHLVRIPGEKIHS